MPMGDVRGIDVRRTHLPPRPLAPRRGIPAGFERFEAVAEDGEPATLLAPWLGTVRVRGELDPAAATLHEVTVGWLRIGYLTLPDGAQIDAPRVPDHQLVIAPVSGDVLVMTGGTEVRATSTLAACPQPGVPVSLRREREGPVMLLAVTTDGLRRGADVLLGRTPDRDVRFTPDFDLLAPRAARWQTAVALLHAEIAALEGQDPGPDLLPVATLVTTTLLLVHGSEIADALAEDAAMQADRGLRRAVRYALARLDEPLRVADVAAAGRMSERNLQLVFRQVYRQTPTAWLRDRRLERARDELAQASARDVTVAAVAHRWQFSNSGRFATAYRERFGELPSVTLAR